MRTAQITRCSKQDRIEVAPEYVDRVGIAGGDLVVRPFQRERYVVDQRHGGAQGGEHAAHFNEAAGKKTRRLRLVLSSSPRAGTTRLPARSFLSQREEFPWKRNTKKPS